MMAADVGGRSGSSPGGFDCRDQHAGGARGKGGGHSGISILRRFSAIRSNALWEKTIAPLNFEIVRSG
jgi:hypothetical protein